MTDFGFNTGLDDSDFEDDEDEEMDETVWINNAQILKVTSCACGAKLAGHNQGRCSECRSVVVTQPFCVDARFTGSVEQRRELIKQQNAALYRAMKQRKKKNTNDTQPKIVEMETAAD